MLYYIFSDITIQTKIYLYKTSCSKLVKSYFSISRMLATSLKEACRACSKSVRLCNTYTNGVEVKTKNLHLLYQYMYCKASQACNTL